MPGVIQQNNSALDYSKKLNRGPVYKMLKEYTYNQVVPVLALTGEATAKFRLSPNVMNLSRSYLGFDLTWGAHGVSYNLHSGCNPFVKAIRVKTTQGTILSQCEYQQQHSKLTWATTTPLEEFLTYPQFEAGATLASAKMGFNFCKTDTRKDYPRAQARASVDADHPTNAEIKAGVDANDANALVGLAFPVDAIPQHDYGQSIDSTGALCDNSEDYIAVKRVAGSPANGSVYSVMIPFKMFKDTLLAFDKDIYFGGNKIDVEIVFAPVNTWGTQNANEGTLGATAIGNVPVISDLQMYLATEVQPEIEHRVKAKFSAGESIVVPWIEAEQYQLNATAQNIMSKFIDSAQGRTLLRVYNGIFHNDEEKNTSLLNANSDDYKNINTIQSKVNGAIQQDYELQCGKEDWLHMKDMLEGSCIQSQRAYDLNWLWVDDFSGVDKAIHFDKTAFNNVSGIPLGVDLEYSLQVKSTNLAQRKGYQFLVLQRVLHIKTSGITIV